jgi:lipopolysaccharide transport system ATP-binding protein
MSSEDIAIRLEGVSKRYELYDKPRDRLKQFVLPLVRKAAGASPVSYFREFWALRDVSFEVKRGEPIGIVGRNGSGKSTLLQIITGTLAATTGTVTTHGRIAAIHELGSGFNPEFSGRENVFLNAALLGFRREEIEEKFDAIAAFADIGQYLEQPVKTYSSGMLVRLAFAVQVQVEPDILIIDEALAVGDALFQKRCLQRIAKLVDDGTTLLFVSHDQENVRTLTSRALLLDKGRPAAWGPTPEVLLEYRRRLNEEEESYFSAAVRDVATRARAEEALAQAVRQHTEPAQDIAARSFGNENIAIMAVETLDGDGKPCAVYFPGDTLLIRVTCRANVEAERLNVSVRIRNKEGVKIYSWGTLNQDMAARSRDTGAPTFWSRKVKVGETFAVLMQCACNLGVNLYEVQAGVSIEETPDYMSQRIVHWIDEAAFFQVLMKKEEHFFGGAVDLRMKAIW